MASQFGNEIEQDDGEQPQRETTAALSVTDWSKNQTIQHTSQIVAGRTDAQQDQELTDEVLTQAQDKLLDAYIMKSKRELIIKRMQLGMFMVQQLFEKADKAEEGSAEREEALGKANYLEQLLMKQCDIVGSIMKNIKEMEPKKKRLAELTKRNLELKIKNRKKMEVIKTKEESKKEQTNDNETKELMEQLENRLQKVSIARHTLQGLVVGSGVNWAKDPEQEELVLSLGEQFLA